MAPISEFNLIPAKYYLVSPQDFLNKWDAQDALC